jgi:hypothetical protein
MIRKLIAGLAVVGILAVGSATVVSAETSSGTTNPSAQTDQTTVHDRVCNRANRLVTFLEKWQTQLDNRITKLQAKQAQLAQTDPTKAAKVADLITKLQTRSSELKEYTDKIAGAIGEKCPAPAPAAAPTTTS